MKSMDDKNRETAAKLTAFLHSEKARKLLIVCGVIGIALLAIPEFFSKKTTPVKTEVTTETFILQTEEKLTSVIGSIAGAGECRVMVTLENGVEYVYATEQKTNTDRQEDSNADSNKSIQRDGSEETIILVDSDSGRKGLLITEIQPTIKGVVIVCEGGDDEKVRERIVQAVTVALNISSKRVCVTKLM